MAPRLDTPLSKALLEAGALDPSALEEAVQEQVIHGGALDTLLLEKGAVDERKLAELLSRAWSTEAVDLAHIEKPAPEAVRALPERMALAMKICPYAVEGTAIHVMCAAPLDRALIEEVSALLLKPLVPHVVPEVRLWQALQRAYGTPPDERFIALLTDLNVSATPSQQSLDDVPLDGDGTGAGGADSADPGAARWDLVEALAHLAAQESRDGIARVAVSYARKFLPFAAMVGVRGSVQAKDASCVGWLRSGPAEGIQFLNKSFHVSEDCVLDGALESPSPSLGKPAITAGNAALFGWLGRRRPRTFLVVPVVVAGRPIGALLADGGIRARDFGSLSELVAFAARLGPAFEALLRQRHRQHPSLFPQAAQPSSPEPSPEEIERRNAKKKAFDIHTEVTAPMPQVAAAPAFSDAHATLADQPGAPLIGDPRAQIAQAVPGSSEPPAPPPLPSSATKTAPMFSMPALLDAPTALSTPNTPGLPPDEPAPAPPPMIAARPLEAQALPPDEVPAPPPLAPPPEPAAGFPRPVTLTSMPRIELDPPAPEPRKDGTSPFARNYVVQRNEAPEPPRPPQGAAAAPPPRDYVFEDLSSGLARIEAPGAFADVTDTHAPAAWRGALEETVERGHQGGTVPAEDRARIFLDEDGWEDIRYDGGDAANPGANSGANADSAISMPVLMQTVEAIVAAVGGATTATTAGATTGSDGPLRNDATSAATAAAGLAPGPAPAEAASPLEELVDHLDALDEGTVARAKKALLDRGVEAIPALSDRFPGRLRVDPFDPGEAVRDAAHLGPLIDVLHSLGPAGLDGAVPHLDSRYPAHRFAAVLLFALMPDARGIELLRARLHDQEPRIRQLAADALAPFVAHPRFESVLVHLRERLASPLLEARRRAVQLLGGFRDVGAVPLLITLLDGKPPAELATDAQRALRAITLQDHGVRARGWDKWWQKAKKRSRVDWLIEGLASEDRELRAIAHVELAALAGDDFGYRPDDDKRKRMRAIATFQTWWAEEQKPKRPAPVQVGSR